MKKAVLFMGLLVLFGAITAHAGYKEKERDKKSVILSAEQVVNGDYIATGDTIILSGTINGNAYIAGNSIIIDGTVNGDVYAIGGSVTIRGTVKNDVRMGAGNATLSGLVGGGVIAVGGNIQLTDSARIAGSLVAGAGNLQIFSPVGRGVIAGAGQLSVGSSVGGNIIAGTGTLTVSKGAQISGNLTYAGQLEAVIASDAVISGEVIRKALPSGPNMDKRKLAGAFTGVWAMIKFAKFIGLLLLGYILLKFAPKFMRKTVDTANMRPWFTLLVGLVTVVAVPLATIVLVMTLIGIPISAILFATMLILLPVSNVVAGYFIGNRVLALLKRKERTFGALFVGLILLCIVRLIPFVGWPISCAFVLMGLGSLLLQKKEYVEKMRTDGML